MFLEFAFAFIVCFFIFEQFRSRKNLPPGPWGIPILGRPPLMNNSQAVKMREKFGDVFRIKTGCVNFIYIADYKLVKEAFSQIDFADRPAWRVTQLTEYEKMMKNSYGVFNANGAQWQSTRRFLLRQLGNFGMGKSTMEDIIHRETVLLVDEFKKLTGKPSTIPFAVNIAILNIIWMLTAGSRYDFTDYRVEEFMNKIHGVQLSRPFLPLLTEFLPFLNYIIPSWILDNLFDRKQGELSVQDFASIVQPFIDEHIQNLDPKKPQDLMDEYLIEMKEKKSKEYLHFCNEDLVRNTMALFLAGTDPIANLICWVLFYMAKFPDVQKKIQKLLDEVMQKDNFPALKHREHLAYLDATIFEVHRHCTMLPFNFLRATNSDVTLHGYHIPKGSVVSSLPGIIHRDPIYWKNPEEFDPSRFLDRNGQFILQKEGFIPFGIGKRQCLGEHLAKVELFLIVSALLHKFTFAAKEGSTIDLTPTANIVIQMAKKDQELCIQMRH